MIVTTSAALLSRDELFALSNWCRCQPASLSDDLGAQTLLNLYHASSEYVTAVDWLEYEPDALQLFRDIVEMGDVVLVELYMENEP